MDGERSANLYTDIDASWRASIRGADLTVIMPGIYERRHGRLRRPAASELVCRLSAPVDFAPGERGAARQPPPRHSGPVCRTAQYLGRARLVGEPAGAAILDRRHSAACLVCA